MQKELEDELAGEFFKKITNKKDRALALALLRKMAGRQVAHDSPKFQLILGGLSHSSDRDLLDESRNLDDVTTPISR